MILRRPEILTEGENVALDSRKIVHDVDDFITPLPYTQHHPRLRHKPAALRTIEELPSVGLWLAMVQREVGERLAAPPGDGAYGAPSVIAQLACEVEVLRAVPRTVFHPVPNVDSVLVRLRRRGVDDPRGDGRLQSDAEPESRGQERRL